MTPRTGVVWHGADRVGNLQVDAHGRFRFAYDLQWLREGFAISLTLPLSLGATQVDAHAFFEGLLPEGRARERICRQLRIAENDDAGLLLAIGADCAGALSVLPADRTPASSNTALNILSPDDFARLIESHGQAWPAMEGPIRFSLAGAQNKAAVVLQDQAVALPDTNNPSTHILKFETIRWVCFAEFMAHDLARRVGLDVPAVEYHRHRGEQGQLTPYLCIDRYDRRRTPTGERLRIHQEDIAQAMGHPSRGKYESDGGPSLAEVTQLLRSHTADPVREVARLRDWQAFNYLIGNSDAHAKNLSLLYEHRASPRLAPFYDLVCIEFLDRIGVASYDRSMAFSIGAHGEPEQVTRSDWEALARSMRIAPRVMLQRLDNLANRLPAIATEARASFAQQHHDNRVYDRFEESIRDRCRWVLNNTLSKR